MAAQLLNLEVVDEARATMRDKFPMMVGYFMEDAENYIHEVKDYVQKRDLENAVRPAHTLKSSARQMGAERLSLVAAEIESQARTGREGLLPQLVENLDEIFEETRRAYPVK